jgi:hypothetical protein
LIIIAGPSCVGKSTLIDRIQDGKLPLLCDQLGLDNSLSYTFISASKLPKLSQSIIKRLVVHYDFYRQKTPDGFNYFSELVKKYDTITILTLWTSSEILLLRERSRVIRAVFLLFISPRFKRIHSLGYRWQRYQFYRDPFKVDSLYDRWFKFLNRHCTAPHWLIDSTTIETGMAKPFKKQRAAQ